MTQNRDGIHNSDMDDIGHHDTPLATGDAPDRPIKLQLSELMEDARHLARVEFAYYQTKLNVNLAATKTVISLFAVGSVLAIVAIIALILGLLIGLSTIWGPWAATAAIVLITATASLLLILSAIKRARQLPIKETPGAQDNLDENDDDQG